MILLITGDYNTNLEPFLQKNPERSEGSLASKISVELVGTGRFELPNCSCLAQGPLARLLFVCIRFATAHRPLGCFVGRQQNTIADSGILNFKEMNGRDGQI